MTLSGRHILLTGAARGLGAVMARHLSEAGARLTLADILEDEGRAVAKALSADFHPVDLRDPASIQTLAASLNVPLHGLVNNGAIATGIGGTPMGAFSGNLSGEEIWNLVHYIQSLSGRAF